jgi:hypothetical protein
MLALVTGFLFGLAPAIEAARERAGTALKDPAASLASFGSQARLRKGFIVAQIGIPYGSNPDTCPIRSLQDWIERSGITEGALFRPINRYSQMAASRLSAGAVAEIVKRYAGAVGLDASGFAGHSLRSGLATSAAMAGASERSIMNQTGHRSVNTVRRYIRDGSLFRENAAAVLGL